MRGVYDKLCKERNIPIVDIDIDLQPEEAARHRPGTILPVLVLFDGDREVARIVGEKSKKELVKRLEELHS
jgi:hypothetical protein